MNIINMFFAENPDFKVVAVTFPSSTKRYHYKALIADLEVGDYVVVDSPSQGFVVVPVVNVTDATELTGNYNYKWVVSKVDVEQYEAIKTAEVEAQKKLNHLKYTKQRRELLEEAKLQLGEDGFEVIKGLTRL